MEAPIIQVDRLVKKYGDFTAVDDVSFRVKSGAVFGFLGPNGAGKSTTMRILSTLLKMTSGSVTIAGHNLAKEPDAVRRSIGFAMQNISLDNVASGWENLQLLGVLYGLSPRAARVRAGELLEIVGLSKVADQWVTQYSGGMRRRLDLAGVLMHSPKILFLDEPTEGLDPQARRTIWEYLQQLNRDGSTLFLTTHYMDEADALCETIAFIDSGKIVQTGTPSELKSQMGGDVLTIQFATEEKANGANAAVGTVLDSFAKTRVDGERLHITANNGDQLIPKLIAALDSAGLAPISLQMSQPTLEDVFVKLVGHSITEEDTKNLLKGRDPFVSGRNG